ncbi:hypothetical protein Droror1_Dr00017481, partial [Drosera rotundifolia]
ETHLRRRSTALNPPPPPLNPTLPRRSPRSPSTSCIQVPHSLLRLAPFFATSKTRWTADLIIYTLSLDFDLGFDYNNPELRNPQFSSTPSPFPPITVTHFPLLRILGFEEYGERSTVTTQSLTCSGCSEWVENYGVVCHVSMIFALKGCGNKPRYRC